MRITNDYNEPTLTFVEDTKHGVRCTCPNCNNDIDITNKDIVCPICKAELIYPGWASW